MQALKEQNQSTSGFLEKVLEGNRHDRRALIVWERKQARSISKINARAHKAVEEIRAMKLHTLGDDY